MNSLEMLRTQCAHPSPGGGGAGEGDHTNSWVSDYRLTDVRASRQQAEESRGQPGLFEDAREDDATTERGTRIRFEQYGVTERECRRATERIDRIKGKCASSSSGAMSAKEYS
jgi:hypothetical protein